MEEEKGLRYNHDKLRYSLIPSEIITELAKVYTMGAKKYDAWNWMKGLSFAETMDSLERHYHAWKQGEEDDHESGLPHLSHMLWNVGTLLYFCHYYEAYANFDDRRLP